MWIKPYILQAVEKCVQRQLHFHARKVLADAHMRTIAKRDMSFLFAKNIDLMRVAPKRWVAVGSGNAHPHDRCLLDREAEEHHIAGGDPVERRDGNSSP